MARLRYFFLLPKLGHILVFMGLSQIFALKRILYFDGTEQMVIVKSNHEVLSNDHITQISRTNQLLCSSIYCNMKEGWRMSRKQALQQSRWNSSKNTKNSLLIGSVSRNCTNSGACCACLWSKLPGTENSCFHMVRSAQKYRYCVAIRQFFFSRNLTHSTEPFEISTFRLFKQEKHLPQQITYCYQNQNYRTVQVCT